MNAPLTHADVVKRAPGFAIAGLQVLLVEDEPLIALDIEMALEDANALVHGPAPSVAIAHSLLDDDWPIDVAILDVNLQDSEVYPVAERLQRAGVPFVFHTGHASRSELLQRFPGCIVCRKPVSTDTLLEALEDLIIQRSV
jgi:DNA-binding NtrC family response regulator